MLTYTLPLKVAPWVLATFMRLAPDVRNVVVPLNTSAAVLAKLMVWLVLLLIMVVLLKVFPPYQLLAPPADLVKVVVPETLLKPLWRTPLRLVAVMLLVALNSLLVMVAVVAVQVKLPPNIQAVGVKFTGVNVPFAAVPFCVTLRIIIWVEV